MARHILQLVTSGNQPLDQVVQILESCSSNMIDILQIREKKRTARDLLSWYDSCSSILPHTSIMINDRVDVAAAAEAAGVQLTHHSLSPEEARRLLPEHMIIGCSVHSIQEVHRASIAGAHFVIYGHIYTSSSKPGIEPRGIELLRHLVESSDLPVIAIGGIQTGQVDEILSTGASGIAVMSSVFEHANPKEQVEQFRFLLDQTSHKPRHPFPKL